MDKLRAGKRYCRALVKRRPNVFAMPMNRSTGFLSLTMQRAVTQDWNAYSRAKSGRLFGDNKNWGLSRVGNIRLWAARFSDGQSPVCFCISQKLSG